MIVRFRWLLMLLVASMVVVACAQAPATPQTVPQTVVVTSPPQIIESTVEVQVTVPPQIVEATVEVPVPADAGSLVIYSGRSEALVGPIITQFQEATGIEVEVRYGSTAEMAATLLEEGENSPADIFFAQDPGGLGAVANEGLFATLPAELAGKVPAEFRSPEDLWVGISARARVVVYNTDIHTPDTLPTTLEAFTDPAWSGKIGWAPSNGSFQAMVTAMRVAWGEEETRAWLEGVQANNPIVFDNNVGVVEGVAAGEAEVGFVNHYYLYRYLTEQGESFTARNYFIPDGGPGSLVMVAGAGRLTTGQNEANAIKFLDFMVSPVAQQYFAGQTYEYPLVEGINTPSGLTPLAELNRYDIDMVDLSDLAGTVTMLQDTGILQ